MKKAATSSQFRELIAKLLVKVDERSIDGTMLQKAIDCTDQTVRNFVYWINNGALAQIICMSQDLALADLIAMLEVSHVNPAITEENFPRQPWSIRPNATFK